MLILLPQFLGLKLPLLSELIALVLQFLTLHIAVLRQLPRPQLTLLLYLALAQILFTRLLMSL